MKKCKKCGALQSDDRSTCVDCGTLLGRAMSADEAAEAEAAIDDKIDGLAERAEDFYVPLRDKIMGVISIIGIAAAIVLLVLVGRENARIEASIPDSMYVTYGNGATVIAASEIPPGYVFPSSRIRVLNGVGYSAVFAIIAFAASAPMLLVPRFMWFIDTLKYRVFYNWDTTPSYFALLIRKAVTYIMFGGGVIAIIYGYYNFF